MKITRELEQIIDVSIQKAVKRVAAEILKAGEDITKNDTGKKDYFKMTESLLYNYPVLKEQIGSVDEYVSTVGKGRSKSIIYWTTGKNGQEDIEDRIKSRLDSFERTRADVIWIEQALEKIKDREEYFIIEKRYLQRKEDGGLYTYEEITEMYCEYTGKEISERTVRRYKTKMIRNLSVLLFGSDVLEM